MVRPSAKVTTDRLQKVVNEESIGSKMNDLCLCLVVVYGQSNDGLTFAYEYGESNGHVTYDDT